MDWIASLFDWAKSHDFLLGWLFAASAALFLLTPIAATWAIIRLPADYFTQEERRPLGSWARHPTLRVIMLALKNILGILLLVAGLLMLMLPGQGLLTVLVGLMLIDFPSKFRLQRWLVTRRQVWRSINWVRKRAKKSEMKRPT